MRAPTVHCLSNLRTFHSSCQHPFNALHDDNLKSHKIYYVKKLNLVSSNISSYGTAEESKRFSGESLNAPAGNL